MRITKKKALGVAAGVSVVALGAGAAFAYWTSTGSGTGTGTAGTTGTITIHQLTTPAGMTVAENTQPLGGDFTNTGVAVTMNRVVGTITGISGAGTDASKPACAIGDFIIEGTGVITGDVVPNGTHVGTWSGLTLRMVNKPLTFDGSGNALVTNNQDNCKNATVNISYSLALV